MRDNHIPRSARALRRMQKALDPVEVRVLLNAELRGLGIPGNYLGTTRDLAGPAARHTTGLFPVTVNFVFRNDPAGFPGWNNTSADRFGSVTFLHA